MNDTMYICYIPSIHWYGLVWLNLAKVYETKFGPEVEYHPIPWHPDHY